MADGKLFIITDNTQNQVNGVVTTYRNITKEANKDGWDIIMISPDMFPSMKAPRHPEVSLSLPWGLRKQLKKAEYVHIATEGPLGLAARLQCKTFTSAYHTNFAQLMGPLEGVTEKYLNWFHSKSKAVLVPTAKVRPEWPNRVVWTRGVDRDLFSLGPGGPGLLYVGRVSWEKNLDAFCSLRGYPLRVVGDGPALEHFKAKYPHVEFSGMLSGQKLADAYKTAGGLVFPSKWDTFGLVMIEAMACGTPVLAYPEASEVVDFGTTGIITDDLQGSVYSLVKFDRPLVRRASERWSWESSWKTLKSQIVLEKSEF